MKIAYIAAGAAGMYCGTCIHDNTLVAIIQKKGHDIALIPTYTPLRTDEENVSLNRVFYGGVNVYLQQKLALFRYTPWFLDRFLDSTALLNSLSRFSSSTNAKDLGTLTISMLEGEEGHQKKELRKLIKWLKDEYKPDIVQLTNSMFVGLAREIKKALGVPVLCALQGEDIFLDDLVEPYRTRAMEILRKRSLDVDGFIAPCQYYASMMAGYLNVTREKISVVPLGINLSGHGIHQQNVDDEPFVIGYLARICPEKGLHILVDAFHQLTQRLGVDKIRLKVAGYLGGRDKSYFEEIERQINVWGLSASFEHWGEVNREQKIRFLNSIHVLSVPTIYKESKGLFVLEALANGIPVVQPRHGSFPEFIEATSGGILTDPES
ncbi:TPA: glycosyltransferase, partial [Candidatus Poribacteria bacterium]|nr:glycosyltransferase [Candidatus Poribacteria bacterium]